MGGREKKLRVEGRERKRENKKGSKIKLSCWKYSTYNRAHPCEVEGVVSVDESHGISGSSESVDLLVWISNQHLGAILCFDYTDNGYAGGRHA